MLKYRTMVWHPNANHKDRFVPEHWETVKEGELGDGPEARTEAEVLIQNLGPGEALGFWIDPAS